MKKAILLFILYAFAVNTFAQKPTKEKPPTAAEMKAMMKNAQVELDKLDPQTKRMMDSLGIKIPTFDEKAFDKNAKQIDKMMEEYSRVVPLKDATRIATIPKEPLTKNTLNTYLQKTHQTVLNKLPKLKKDNAEKILSKLNENQWYGTAIGLWMNGNNEMALYILGKEAVKNQENTDVLNNYAAYISMAGGEQWAIPILNLLNKEYPYNSTVLNNLGQAWFGLGEIDLATKHLNSCIAIAPNHSQANATKCLILEEKGKTAEAVEAMKKSIKENYTIEKADKLKDLGYKIKMEDIKWNYTKRDDNLGLGNFTFPEYHLSYKEQRERMAVIADFALTIKAKLFELKNKVITYEVNAPDNQNKTLPSLFHKAFLLKQLSRNNNNEVLKTAMKALRLVEIESQVAWDDVSKVIDANASNVIIYDDGRQTGCGPIFNAFDKWFGKYNPLLRAAQEKWFTAQKNYTNDEIYYEMFLAENDKYFENEKYGAQMNWLNDFASMHKPLCFYNWCNASGNEKTEKENENVPNEKKHKLAYFDDLNCPNPVSVNTPIGSYTIACHKSTFELNPGIKALGLKQDLGFDYKYEGDSYRGTSTHEIGMGWEKSISKSASKGPFSAEAKAEVRATVFVEFDSKGVSDVGVKATANAGASATTNATDLGELDVKIGNISAVDANVKIGVNSGVSGEIKSILGNRKF